MKPKVIADSREKNSLVIAELRELGVDVEIKHLKLADYLISKNLAVERKTINDFVSSMINKRIILDWITRFNFPSHLNTPEKV